MVTILTGPVGGGKTTLLGSAVALLGERRTSFDGYLSQRVMEGEYVSGYDLLDLRSGRRCSFLRREGSPEWPHVGQYAMNPEGLAAAEKILGRCAPSDLLVLDELGRLELEGKGIWPAACPLLSDHRRSSVVVIRETLLDSYLTGPLADRPVRIIVCSKSAAAGAPGFAWGSTSAVLARGYKLRVSADPEALIRDLLSSWIPRPDTTGSDGRP